jgi:putative redox protein
MDAVQHVEFDNGRGRRLAGLLHRPDAWQHGTAVVVAHGMLSSKDSDKLRDICQAACSLGWLALRFDFSGRGESRAEPTELSFSGDLEDLRSALGLVRGLGAARLVLVGSSMGGAASVLVAVGEPDVQSLVTIATPAWLQDRPQPNWTATWLEQIRRMGRLEAQPGLYVSGSLFDELARYDLLAAAARLHMPWLVLHGRLDELIPAGDAAALAAAGGRARLEIHPEADHRFSRPEWRAWLVERITAFLRHAHAPPTEL